MRRQLIIDTGPNSCSYFIGFIVFLILAAAILGIFFPKTTFPDNQNVTVSNFPMMENVTVKNFPELQNVSVTNFPMMEDVNVKNFPDNQNVTVTNSDEIFCNISVGSVFLGDVIIEAISPNGQPKNLTSSSNGALYTEMISPRAAQGNILVDKLYPIFQADAVYGINFQKVIPTTFGSGEVSTENSAFVVNSGSTPTSFAVLQSRKRLYYNSGQGSRCVFSARFPQSALPNATIQVAGLATPEDGILFGYVSGIFGILHVSRGERQIQKLTVTTGSSTDETATVTLNGVVYNPPVTNSGDIQRTVYELASFHYAGWKAQPLGATVLFISDQAEPYLGVFSFSATTAVASFSLERLGKVRTTVLTPQAAWNGDPLDGTGPSGVTLIPDNFNVYTISAQYLGAGSIRFFVDIVNGFNIPEKTLVHTIPIPNSGTITSFANPTFPFSAAVRTFGTVNATLQIGGTSGFVEGDKIYTGNRLSFSRSITTVMNTAYEVLFTIRNAVVIEGQANQGVITIVAVSGAMKHTQVGTLYLFKSNELYDHTLTGNPDFQPYGFKSGVLYDDSAIEFTPTTNSQLIWSGEMAETGNIQRVFLHGQERISLEPGESLSLCARTAVGNAAWVAGSLEIREDN